MVTDLLKRELCVHVCFLQITAVLEHFILCILIGYFWAVFFY
jgi:hypothetical protein